MNKCAVTVRFKFLAFSLPLMLLAIFECTSATAEEDRGLALCGHLLKPDVTQFRRDRRMQLAYINTISESQYNSAKSSGTLDALIPIEGLPIKIGASYGEFNQSRASYNSKVNYTLDESDSIRYYSSRIPVANASLFISCLRSQAPSGLFMYAAQPANESGNVLVEIEWRPPGGLNSTIRLSLDADNGTISSPPNSLTPNGRQTFWVTRTNRASSLTVNANGTTVTGNGQYPAYFSDPAPPPDNSTACRSIHTVAYGQTAG